VCSIFGDLGYNARATAYGRNGGVDIVLEGSAGTTVGVQVKRYVQERRIQAEQIRSLAGALLVNGHTRGVFVTTSSFRRGAKATAKEVTATGYPVELMDAERVLDALGISQFNSSELDQERYAAYVLSHGVDLGSGRAQEFVAGENLVDHPVVMQAIPTADLIDHDAMGGT
jgi:hypothetical protein